MKQKICIITALFILLSATFSQTIFAQTAKTQAKVLTQDEIDKREVTKFADSFMTAFDDKKDIRMIPSEFFAKEFKSQLAKIGREMFSSDLKLSTDISDSEISELIILIHNFNYLSIMTNDGRCCMSENNHYYTPKVSAILNSNKFLAATFGEGDKDIGFAGNLSRKELPNIIFDLNRIHKAQVKYLLGRPKTWKKTYKSNITETRKNFIDYNSFLASEDELYRGIPKGTLIFEVGVFPFGLLMVKEKLSFKIVNILPFMQ
jgi:hypothetical protein